MTANRFRFRAWDKVLGVSEVRAIEFATRIVQIESKGTFYNVNLDNIVLMQSTGLLDKNEKEIFEGDIVRWQAWTNRPIEDGEVGTVVWDRKGKWSFDTNYIDHEIGIYMQMEIIGNIYQNPDLLPST